MNVETLIKDNERLIYKIASKFYGADKDDLYQAGVLGLLKAFKNFNNSLDAKFTTYAYEYIYGEMYQLVNNKILKINKDILKLFRVIEKTRSALCQRLGKIPSNEEIASFLELDVKDVYEAINAGMEIMSLDSEKERPYYEMISQKPSVEIDDEILISESLDSLTNDEKEIIKARYYEDLTQSEVAKKLCMTQVMVSRYEKKGLNKMQAFMCK